MDAPHTDPGANSADPQTADAVRGAAPPDAATSGSPAYARLDHPRAARTGEPEVVLGEHKTPEQVATLLRELAVAGAAPALATRCSPEHAAACPEARYDPTSRLLVARAVPVDPATGHVAVACAGTSDLPVAAEAVGTLEAFGVGAELIADVGVAGVHRVLAQRERLAAADVCIVVAGMDGALPSVVAGLVPCPVIAVPTSVGYGAAFDGLAALLTMLSSCSPGITVVNIDAGFNAALAARRALRTRRGAAPSASATAAHPAPADGPAPPGYSATSAHTAGRSRGPRAGDNGRFGGSGP